MATQEIEQGSWPAFLDDFSKRYEGGSAVLETLGTDEGDQQTTSLPFQGISYERKGSDAGAIIIMLGTEEEDHIERIINDVTSLQYKPAGEAGPAVLEIKAQGEPTVLLHLEPMVALPAP